MSLGVGPALPRCLLFLATILLGLGLGRPRASDARAGPDTACVWYLHNSGWAIETAGHLLIFDGITTGAPDAVGALITRLLEDSRRADRPVVVFVSHEHEDHCSGAIHKWRKQARRIFYRLPKNYFEIIRRRIPLPKGMRVEEDAIGAN